ncbi:MAG: citrate synthase/methylcitrate synthase [Deferrisomatales bacterium]
MSDRTDAITQLILKAAEKARQETSGEPEPDQIRPVKWPVQCTVGPGLEGAIACESRIGYVNGSKGWLVYRGYDIFDLCAYSTYEEVCYLLLHGELPTAAEYERFRAKLVEYRRLNRTLRILMGFPLEEMNAMSALRMGTNMMRQEFTYLDHRARQRAPLSVIGADEDSIPMETAPRGSDHATYEFKRRGRRKRLKMNQQLDDASGLQAAYHLISGVATVAAAIYRVHQGHMPIEPDPDLSHAANLLYMMTGRRPSPVEERVMDVALILHADHGMNASTFAAMVVASTLSDVYFSVGSGIAALNGPLHGGANERVIHMLEEIREHGDVTDWLDRALADKQKIMGFGHRVYKAYDPRARVLGPLAACLTRGNERVEPLFRVARELEKQVIARFGNERKIFPNVDFYSGIVYSCLGVEPEMFTPIFAVSRVAGWTARVLEYLQNNRIFRPRARYVGEFAKAYLPLEQRREQAN